MRLHRASLPVSLLLALTVVFLAAGAAGQSPSRSTSAAAEQNPPSSDQSSGTPPAQSTEHMSKQTRLEIIRDFETQLVYSRSAFPMGAKGLRLKDGVVSPNGEELQQALALWGPAVKPGDPAHISFVQIKDDHIHFEINGGPVHRRKWYQHITVAGANGAPVTPSEPQANPHGSFVDLCFDRYVPELTAKQVRELLLPVLDFNARNKEEAYLDTVPPRVKKAIQKHQVLVGMNIEMLVHSRGRPPKKVREKDGETDYEEWIYGEPPEDVDFVRIVGDEVVRVETMKVGGEKIIRAEREVELPQPDKEAKKEKEPEERPANAPSLRRPGEDAGEVPKPADGASPAPPPPPPNLPVPSGPGEIMAGGR